MTSKTSWPSTVNRSNTVLQHSPETAFVIAESEWSRVRQLVTEIIPYANWYQLAGSVFLGVFVSFVCM